MKRQMLFDSWPERYDRWFTTPLGRLVKQYEKELIFELLRPEQGEMILDAGCGTGVFTIDILATGACVVGLDISMPMLVRAGQKIQGYPFSRALGDVMSLPFADHAFDKVVSITTLEFISDAKTVLREFFRVTKRGGCLVVATLNSLSPWAARRTERAKRGQSTLFEKVIFRSPDDMDALTPVRGVIKTAIHFQKDDDPEQAKKIELRGQSEGSNRGAFLAARWENG